MPGRTLGEKVDELSKFVFALIERVDRLRLDIDKNEARLSELARELSDLKNRVTVLETIASTLQRSQEKWGQRLWMILAPLVAAVVASLLTYFLQSP